MSVIDGDVPSVPAAPTAPATPALPSPRRRSWLEIRRRQFRNAPRPVVRAVASSLIVAIVCGFAYLAYDLAITSGARLPGGDLRALAVVLDVAIVLGVGSVVTWLIVPLPTGSGTRARRTAWSAALGLLAAVPICYLVLVLVAQVIKPVLVST